MTWQANICLTRGAFALNAQIAAPNGVSVLFGRSGSGKTTIAQAIAGLVKPDSGLIRVQGQTLCDAEVNVPVHKRRIGYVFQDARLFPHLSVKKNLTYAQRFRGETSLGPVVDMLGLSSLLDRAPDTLSGGEQQRVAIGRALLSDPRMLIMDEPLASLDDNRRQGILPYLETLRDHSNIPILYITHSISEATRLADHIVLLHDGQVVDQGPVQQVLSNPDASPALGARQTGTVIQGRLIGQDVDHLSRVETSAGVLLLPRVNATVGTILRVRINAQDVMLASEIPLGISALNILSGTISDIHQSDGVGARVRLRCGTDLILARITNRSLSTMGLQVGQTCHVILKSVSIARDDIGQREE